MFSLLVTAACSLEKSVSPPTPTPTPTPIPTSTPVPVSLGWRADYDSRLGYSIDAPPDWIKIDVHSEDFDTAITSLSEYEPLFDSMSDIKLADVISETWDLLKTPIGRSIGLFFLQPDFQPNMFALITGELPFPAVIGVVVIQLPDGTTLEDLVRTPQIPSDLSEIISITELDIKETNSVPMLHLALQVDAKTQGYHLALGSENMGIYFQ